MLKSIKLKEEDIFFLKKICDIDILQRYVPEIHFEEKSKSWILLLNSEELEFIGNEPDVVLMDKGITNGEINAVGKHIDDYIGKFSHYE